MLLLLASIASSLILLLAGLAVFYGGGWIAAYFLVGAFLSVCSFFVMAVLFPPILFYLFLGIPVVLRKPLKTWGLRTAAIAAACVPVIVIVGWNVWQNQREIARLRGEFPLVALDGRLPSRAAPIQTVSLKRETNSRLTAMEKQIGDYSPRRTYILKSLHERTIDHFTNSPGFGVARIYRPSTSNLRTEREERKKDASITQPHRQDLSAMESEQPTQPLRASATLEKLHRDSTIDFVNSDGFGYVTETREIVGFKPHAFADSQKPAGDWSIATVDLVGLLLSESPRVYESKNLPRMDELKNAPTRPLDRFEAEGLEKLKGGEDLIVASTASGVRMLGAIRSAKQCLQCHQGNRGDLLGAFAYRLERKGKE